MLNCDINLWIFLQNIKTLDYEYLCETQEYDLFKSAEYYTISLADIIDDSLITIDETLQNIVSIPVPEVNFSIEGFAKFVEALLTANIPGVEEDWFGDDKSLLTNITEIGIGQCSILDLKNKQKLTIKNRGGKNPRKLRRKSRCRSRRQ